MKNVRMLHLFQWEIKDIINVLNEVKEQGFTAILITSIQPFIINAAVFISRIFFLIFS